TTPRTPPHTRSRQAPAPRADFRTSTEPHVPDQTARRTQTGPTLPAESPRGPPERLARMPATRGATLVLGPATETAASSPTYQRTRRRCQRQPAPLRRPARSGETSGAHSSALRLSDVGRKTRLSAASR